MKKKIFLRILFNLFMKSVVVVMLLCVTSCFYKKIPLSYSIKDVSLQRIAIDEDSILSNKMIYLWTTQIEVAKTKRLPFLYGGRPPYREGCEDSIISLSIESEDGVCLNDKFHSMKEGNGGKITNMQLLGSDTIKVLWNKDLTKQKEILQKGHHVNLALEKCLLIYEDSDTIPHIIRFTFPDKKVESMVNNTPIHYKCLKKYHSVDRNGVE